MVRARWLAVGSAMVFLVALSDGPHRWLLMKCDVRRQKCFPGVLRHFLLRDGRRRVAGVGVDRGQGEELL